eukprot:GCRY01004187.1.p1 GENE.GCRY01004187.1~~GCRY01004187.1.p1  ORF type:complete len:695 (-),score=84.61 GCRY01004187.1:23-2107(-)
MSKRNTKGKADYFVLKEQEVLQALVILDDFGNELDPLTTETSRCLLPICNVPLLEYTLEFLDISCVEEVYLFCTQHKNQVKEYLRDSRWSESKMTVHVITGQNCLSLGDAMRQVENMNIIRSDFILISGGVISNVDLGPLIKDFKEKKKADKNTLMQTVFKNVQPMNGRAPGTDIVLTMDLESKALIQYDILDCNHPAFTLDTSIAFETNKAAHVRRDLIDCGIDMCTVEVLTLFSDNFDYQNLRQDFVRGILTSDLLGHKIYGYEIEKEFAMDVNSLKQYNVTSKCVLHRWAYPLAPDTNFSLTTSYVFQNYRHYIEDNVQRGRGTILGDDVMLGEGTSIGENCRITRSVIGRGCVIGTNTIIEDAFIWDGVAIGDNSIVRGSLVAADVEMGANVVVEPNVILSFQVHIGNGFVVKEGTVLSREAEQDVDDEGENESEEEEGNKQLLDSEKSPEDIVDNARYVGTHGKGIPWLGLMKSRWGINFPRTVLVSQNQDKLQEDGAVFDSDDSGDSDDEVMEEDEGEDWFTETKDIILRGVKEKVKVENLIMEINGLKLSMNRTFQDCSTAIVNTILEHSYAKGMTSKEHLLSIRSLVREWRGLFGQYVSDKDDQVEMIFTVEDFCQDNELFAPHFRYILQFFYDSDVLEEEAVEEWACLQESEPDNPLYKQAQPFLQWLREAESESESEESDEESD